ncbi:unnamed protein product [Clonostachys byssicola]|uniref:Cytochrome P450 n=1 Tax=Clonostachys byssicola TaxID=160290 RepID=A0A9N9U8V6_9HYPO|nr:unnamed protein product [Clonostachys byssicola]
MSYLEQLITFPNVTLAAIAEYLLLIKSLPSYCSSNSHIGIFAAVLVVNYVLYGVFWVVVHPRFMSPLRFLPGPRSLLSVIHRSLLETARPPGELYVDLANQYPKKELLHISLLEEQLFITKPRLLADLLVHRSYDFIKPSHLSGLLRHVLGDGLVIVEGSQHKFLRKNTMPAFHFRHIKNLYPMMWAKSISLTLALQQELTGTPTVGERVDSGVIELTAWASRVTLDIIGIAVMGRSFNMLQKSTDPLLNIYEQLLEPQREKIAFAVAAIVFGMRTVRLLPWKINARFRQLTNSLNEICRPMIQEKRDAIVKNGDDHFDILSLLIKSNNFSDEELKDQLLTFLAAGHETTASAITWACYLLATHQEMQHKLRKEVLEALPSNSLLDTSDMEDLAGTLEQLPYLNGIINETLRLYPTVPVTLRQAIHDTHIAEYPIPKGTVLVLSIWQINRSTEVWGTDADKFIPERWITEAGKPNQTGGANSNYDFVTFLHGPRSCIGQNFARAEMRCLLAAMATSFSWELAMDQAKVLPRGVITIKPAHGLYLKLQPLQREKATQG